VGLCLANWQLFNSFRKLAIVDYTVQRHLDGWSKILAEGVGGADVHRQDGSTIAALP
jgi:hypothetical protein